MTLMSICSRESSKSMCNLGQRMPFKIIFPVKELALLKIKLIHWMTNQIFKN